MNRNPVVWFEIYVQDVDRAKKFYETVLAIELTRLESPVPGLEMLGFPGHMDSGGASGALVKMEGCPSGGMGTLVYFGCDDCAVQVARAAAHGGGVAQEKMSLGEHGFCALARDTEGNTIGFHSMK